MTSNNTMRPSSGMAPLAERKKLRAERHAENRELMADFRHADYLKDVAARDADLAAGGTGEGTDADPDAPEPTAKEKAAAAAAAAGSGWAPGPGVTATPPAPARRGRRNA